MRIPFLDVAKGIAILLVVMVHVGVPEPFLGAYSAKVPIFFFISGLFFKKSIENGNYISKKSKSILLPFAIYYIISYILFYIIVAVNPDFISGDSSFSFIDPVKQRSLFNGPLWFLLSLFEVEAVFYLIYNYIKHEALRALLVLIIALMGFVLSFTKTFLPLWIDASCVALMYFYFGYVFSLSNVQQKSIPIVYLIDFGILTYVLYLLMPVNIGLSLNQYSNYLFAITSGALIILFFLIVSKLLNRVTALSWIGSNSLIILCTHHLIYRPIKYLQIKVGWENPYILFVATLLIEILVVIIVNKWFPILNGKFKKNLK